MFFITRVHCKWMREQLLEGSVPVRAFQYCHDTSPYTPLERLFPCSNTCFTWEWCEWGNRHCEGSVLPPGPYMYSSTNASRLDHHWLKKKVIILNTVYTLEVNRLFLNINVTLMSDHSTHGPWCHCLLLVTATGGEGYLIHILNILHILHL